MLNASNFGRPLRLYNTLTQQMTVLYHPGVDLQTIRIFACGPTVYNHIHLGNARPLLLVDTILRLLHCLGAKTSYLMNITDIDDKIIQQAQAENVSEAELAHKYTKSFYDNLGRLGVIQPHLVPISEIMADQIAFIQNLVTKKAAYVSNGNVFFDVKQFTDQTREFYYNQLAHSQLQAQQTDLQKNLVVVKRSPYDFALWKATTNGITFDSPWGRGRPGWHTECATVNAQWFHGATIDLHVGGIDLKFPHHENERIQYIATYGNDLARIWIYNGHLGVGQVKMSKSLHNFIYLHDFLNQYSADTLRYIFLNANYRRPLQFNTNLIDGATRALKVLTQVTQTITADNLPAGSGQISQSYWKKIISHACQNLNYANVLSEMHAWGQVLLKAGRSQQLDQTDQALWKQAYYQLLGFGQSHKPISASRNK